MHIITLEQARRSPQGPGSANLAAARHPEAITSPKRELPAVISAVTKKIQNEVGLGCSLSGVVEIQAVVAILTPHFPVDCPRPISGPLGWVRGLHWPLSKTLIT